MKKAFTLIWLFCLIPLLCVGQDITNPASQQEQQRTLITQDYSRAPDSPVLNLESVSPEFDKDRFQRIVGGDDANIEDHPWQVALAFIEDGGFFGPICGGSIIDDEWVITAAHCVEDDLNYGVLAGGDDLNANPSFLQGIPVQEVIMHPFYNPDFFPYDVALLRLAAPLDIGPKIAPIDIVTQSDANGGMTNPGVTAQVTGWGATQPDNTEPADWLQMAEVPIRDIEDTDWLPGEITDDMLLAGDGDTDSGGGDSGGPLTVPGPGGQRLAGITSFGPEIGADPDLPGVYARVSFFEDWINSIVNAAEVTFNVQDQFLWTVQE